MSSPRRGYPRRLIFISVFRVYTEDMVYIQKLGDCFSPNVMASLVSSLWAEYLNRSGGVCPFCVLAWHNLLACQQ